MLFTLGDSSRIVEANTKRVRNLDSKDRDLCGESITLEFLNIDSSAV